MDSLQVQKHSGLCLLISLVPLRYIPTSYDRDVCMRMQDVKDGFDYICANVDNFKVIANDIELWIDRIAGDFMVKFHDPRSY